MYKSSLGFYPVIIIPKWPLIHFFFPTAKVSFKMGVLVRRMQMQEQTEPC